jgi:hypothetical protein
LIFLAFYATFRSKSFVSLLTSLFRGYILLASKKKRSKTNNHERSTKMKNELPKEFQEIAENWDFPHVLHRDIEKFTCGAVSRARLSFHYTRGQGPESFKICNKLASSKWKMAEWLYRHTQALPTNNK